MVTTNKGVYVLRKASGGSYLYWRAVKWRDCDNWAVDKNLADKFTYKETNDNARFGMIYGGWHCVGELIPLEDGDD